MPTLTPNYGFYLPLVNNATDQDLWGGYLNSNFSSLDTILQNIQPAGEIKFFPTTTAPTGYLETNGSLVSRITYANLWTFAQASGNLASVDTSAVATGVIDDAGDGTYTDGTYTNVPLTGGNGTGLVATIVVLGGIITTVTLTTMPALAPGSAYLVGDLLSCLNSGVGGTGTGFRYKISSVTGYDLGMFSVGDGSTTFRIPDYRGSFLRGWSNTGVIDSGRLIGTSQEPDIASHRPTTTFNDPGHAHAVNGTQTSAQQGSNSGGALMIGGSQEVTTTVTTGIKASVVYTGASETRPRNIAGMYCIKT